MRERHGIIHTVDNYLFTNGYQPELFILLAKENIEYPTSHVHAQIGSLNQ
jgi:hypothetical protein